MKRNCKLFCAFLMICLLVTSAIPVSAEGESSVSEDNEKILLTEEMALELADNYASLFTTKDVIPCNPIKYYNLSNQPIGYIVDYTYNGNSYGYIIFDSTLEGLIAEVSLPDEDNDSAKNFSESYPKSILGKNIDNKIYKLSPVDYGIKIGDNNEFITNYGDNIDIVESEIVPQSVPTHDWDDVFIDESYNSDQYYIASQGHIMNKEFLSYSQSYVENQTDRYACAITASMICATYYDCVDPTNFRGDYLRLWDLCNTHVYDERGGIQYGENAPADTVSGFLNFCSQKGKNITASTIWYPTLTFYRTCINRGDIGTVDCGINGENGRSGHCMAVEGYAQIVVNGNVLDSVIVANGWDYDIHYLNLDFGDYTDIRGAAFNG